MKKTLVACLLLSTLSGCGGLGGACGEYVGRWRAGTQGGGMQDINIVRDGSAFRLELSGTLYTMNLGARCEAGVLRTGGWLGDITYSEAGRAVLTTMGSFSKVQ